METGTNNSRPNNKRQGGTRQCQNSTQAKDELLLKEMLAMLKDSDKKIKKNPKARRKRTTTCASPLDSMSTCRNNASSHEATTRREGLP
jgi:hypothetical protein